MKLSSSFIDKLFKLTILSLGFCGLMSQALACDPCALFNASQLQSPKSGSLNLSLTNQLTHFNRIGSAPANSQVIKNYNTTLLSASYDLTSDFSLQTVAPLITIDAETTSTNGSTDSIRRNNSTEFGDVVLLANYSPINLREANSTFLFQVAAGVKLPTGDASDLKYQRSQPSIDFQFTKHHPVSSSGGRAITYGSGSVDYLIGLNSLYRYSRFLLLGYLQYVIRNEGAYGYEYHDDFIFQASPGYYLVADDSYSLALAASVTGEYKGIDTVAGRRVNESSLSNLYMGPNLLLTLASGLGAQIALDSRITDADVGIIAPEWRSRVSLSYRF